MIEGRIILSRYCVRLTTAPFPPSSAVNITLKHTTENQQCRSPVEAECPHTGTCLSSCINWHQQATKEFQAKLAMNGLPAANTSHRRGVINLKDASKSTYKTQTHDTYKLTMQSIPRQKEVVHSLSSSS